MIWMQLALKLLWVLMSSLLCAFIANLHPTSNCRYAPCASNCLSPEKLRNIPRVENTTYKVALALSRDAALYPSGTKTSYLLYSFQNCPSIACIQLDSSSGSRGFRRLYCAEQNEGCSPKPVPCYTGSIYTEQKRMSNNRLVVQGTTKYVVYMEDLDLIWTLHSSTYEKVSLPPPLFVTPHLFFLFMMFFCLVGFLYKGLMCRRWLDIFLIKIYALHSYQVSKLAKQKQEGFSRVWASHLQINLLGSLITNKSSNHFDLKGD